MSNNTNTYGTVVEFTPAAGVEVNLHSSRPSKDECLRIGYALFERITDDKFVDAMLDECGPVLIRRSLLVFANYAKRTGQKDVAKYVMDFRSTIVVVKRNAKTA